VTLCLRLITNDEKIYNSAESKIKIISKIFSVKKKLNVRYSLFVILGYAFNDYFLFFIRYSFFVQV